MRVRISYTIEIDDDRRRSINEHYGRPGLATRNEVQDWYENNGSSKDLDLDRASDDRDDYGQRNQ